MQKTIYLIFVLSLLSLTSAIASLHIYDSHGHERISLNDIEIIPFNKLSIIQDHIVSTLHLATQEHERENGFSPIKLYVEGMILTQETWDKIYKAVRKKERKVVVYTL